MKDKALLEAVSNLDVASKKLTELLDDVTASVGPVRTELQTTLKDYSQLAVSARQEVILVSEKIQAVSIHLDKLVATVDSQVGPIGKSARKTLDSANSLVAEDSRARYNLNLMLEEAAEAARSLRMLADYLEQNPDALIKGKY